MNRRSFLGKLAGVAAAACGLTVLKSFAVDRRSPFLRNSKNELIANPDFDPEKYQGEWEWLNADRKMFASLDPAYPGGDHYFYALYELDNGKYFRVHTKE